jgi:hypothetical protein
MVATGSDAAMARHCGGHARTSCDYSSHLVCNGSWLRPCAKLACEPTTPDAQTAAALLRLRACGPQFSPATDHSCSPAEYDQPTKRRRWPPPPRRQTMQGGQRSWACDSQGTPENHCWRQEQRWRKNNAAGRGAPALAADGRWPDLRLPSAALASAYGLTPRGSRSAAPTRTTRLLVNIRPSRACCAGLSWIHTRAQTGIKITKRTKQYVGPLLHASQLDTRVRSMDASEPARPHQGGLTGSTAVQSV